MRDWAEYCGSLRPQERAKLADGIACAIEDGGPSPGADFLARLRERWGVSENEELLRPLLTKETPEAYLTRHWDKQVREAARASR